MRKEIHMNKIKYSALILAASACFSACSDTSDNTAAKTETESSVTEVSSAETVGLLTSATVADEPFDIESGITDAMYERALLNEGDKARLAYAMKKAEKGEKITVATIGGSITQGTAASTNALCYSSLFFKWWQDKFPSAEIETVNAGIGGTNSYLGVSRADSELLSYSPDVVIVEFSVNDTDKVMNKYSYDSLVRKILRADNNPAVILLFTTQENGASLQDIHKEIGAAYDLPMLSYREIVYPEVKAGNLDWKTISPDNIHPNDAGHKIIGDMLGRYLDETYEKRNDFSDPTPFDTAAYTSDMYKDAKLYFPSDITADSMEGFSVGTNKVYPDKYPENWVTEAGGSFSFTAECQTMGLFYLCTTDGKGGKYEVFVDGERRGVIDSDFSGGWGNYGATHPIFMDKEKASHTFEIKAAEGAENTSMTILGVMMS